MMSWTKSIKYWQQNIGTSYYVDIANNKDITILDIILLIHTIVLFFIFYLVTW